MTPTLILGSPESVGFRLYLASDHRTPAPGLAPTVLVSKAGGGFTAPAGSVSGRGGGWYELALTAADLDTPGPLILHATAAGCDPTDWLGWVVAREGLPPLTAGVAGPLPFLMVSLSDGVSGATGLAPTATAYWPGGTTSTGTVSEIGHGWYVLAATPPGAGTAEVAATASGAGTAGAAFEVGRGTGGEIAEFRDRDIYATIKAMLIATGQFGTAAEDRVRVGKANDSARYGSSDITWANVQPNGDSTHADGSPTRQFHRAYFTLTIGVRESTDPEQAYGSDLDRLTAVVRNALLAPGNRTLGGRCLPAETKLADGSIRMTGWPEAERTFRGEFGYCVSLVSSAYSEVV